MKRIQYEDVSKYRNNIELNGRYLLLNLIGKGGFSEVYKAYDYQDQMMVAIKIHQINPEWPEQKKSDYQKWVLIHKNNYPKLNVINGFLGMLAVRPKFKNR